MQFFANLGSVTPWAIVKLQYPPPLKIAWREFTITCMLCCLIVLMLNMSCRKYSHHIV